MSAESINNKREPTVYVVHGVNWHIEVPMDEYNMQFDIESQVYEAASIAIYVFKGEESDRFSAVLDENRDLYIVMDNEDEEPLIASTMIVHKRGTDPSNGFIPFTCEVLANCGFYEDSKVMAKVLEDELAAMQEEEKEREQARTKAIEVAKNIKKPISKDKKANKKANKKPKSDS